MAGLQSLRDLRRLREILGVLILYGFDDFLQWVGLGRQASVINRLLRRQAPPGLARLPREQRARLALEELGPTFVKLGQILATRVDLLPMEWIVELEKLQNHVAAQPFSELRAAVEQSLGRPLKTVFLEVEEEALGSASMAQVHRARLLDGSPVVLKIRRPGLRERVDADMRLLQQLVAIAESQSPEWRHFQPLALLREFRRSLAREMDFSVEARAAERIAAHLAACDYVQIPRVYWDYTSEALNVQELIEGIPATDIAALDAAGHRREVIARRCAAVVWKMMLEDGYFHADPHPGNFLILPGDRIALLDFGMIGRLGSWRREQLLRLVRGILQQEPEVVTQVLLEWSAGLPMQRDLLNGEVSGFIERFDGVALENLDIAALLHDIASILRHHGVGLPSDIALLIKACLTLEGFGRSLAPRFDLMQEAIPLLRKTLRGRYAPKKLARALRTRALDMVERVYHPGSVSALSGAPYMSSGLRPQEIDHWVTRFERAAARQTSATLIAGIAIAGGLLALLPRGPHLLGVQILGWLFLLASALYGGWLWLAQWWVLRGRE